ncbi:MAG: phage tail tape measure protein [Cetobacterium sp.]
MKEQKLTFGIGANLKSGFGSSFSKASETIIGLNAAIEKINTSQKQNTATLQKYMKTISSSTAALKPMKAELETLGKTLDSSKLKMQGLEDKIQKGGRGSKGAAREYNKLKNEVNRLQAEYDKKLSNANKIENQIKREREEVDKLTESYKRNAKQLETAEKVKKLNGLADKSENVGGKVSAAGTKMGIAGAAGVGAITPAIYAAIKSEAAFADVKKQFDFKDEDEEKNFKKELEALVKDKNLAVSIPELYAAAASAGQSGLGQDEAIKYVEHGIKTGIAFDVNKDEASKNLFMLRNSFKLTYDEMVELTDKINMFGNSTGASAAEVTDFVSRVGNIGTVAGFSTGQIAALGATLIEQGMSSDIAATGAKKLMGAMTKGFAASDSQKEAFNMIGLDSEYLAAEAQKDAEGTMLKIFNGIGKLSKDKQGAVITLLFGEEGLRGAAGVLENKGKLISNFKNSKDKEKYNGSVQTEADVRGGTKENKFLVLKSRMDLQMAKMGEILFPDLEKIIKQFGNILDKVAEFQERNPKLFSGIVKGVAYGSVALLGLGATAKIVGFGISGLGPIFRGVGWLVEKEVASKGKTALLKLLTSSKSLFVGLGTGLKTASLAIGGFLKGAVAGLAKFGVALLANPITWYVAGIMAIVAAGYYMYKNWDMLKAKGIELWNSVVQACQPIMELWSNIKGKAAETFNSWVQDALSFKNMFKEALEGVFSWVTGKFEKIIELKNKALNFAGDTFNKGKDIIKNNIPGFAEGGVVNSPTLAMVGEGAYSETIIPHNNSPRSLSLWEKTGQLIGAYDKKEATSNYNSSPIQFTFSPTIYSNDSKNVGREIEKQRELSFREFEKMYDRLEKEKRRRGHGR